MGFMSELDIEQHNLGVDRKIFFGGLALAVYHYGLHYLGASVELVTLGILIGYILIRNYADTG